MDALTLKRAQRAIRRPLRRFLPPWKARVYRTCVHVLGPGEDARDCAQEVLLKAFRTLKDFRGDCALESWLHRLCVNVCLTPCGGRSCGRPVPGRADRRRVRPGCPRRRPLRGIGKEGAHGAFAPAIAWLPEEQRLAFTLVVLEELPYEEAAARLGVATGTVKSRVNRAREKISKICSSGAEPFDASRVQHSEGRAIK